MAAALHENLLGPCGATLVADEPWSDANEELLRSWGSRWSALAEAHETAEAWKRRCAFMLQLPTIIIPLLLTPLLARGVVTEDSPVGMALLVGSGVCSGLQTLLDWGRLSEKHAHTADKFKDLTTDLQELLAKARVYRPRCDVTTVAA